MQTVQTNLHLNHTKGTCPLFRKIHQYKQFYPEELTLSPVELQSQLLACPGLLRQPLLQLLLLLQQLVHLLVVAEGLPHQLSLGHPGMFKLRGGKRKEVVTHGQNSAIGRDSKDSEKRHSINEDQFTFYEENYSCHQGYLGLGLRLSIES